MIVEYPFVLVFQGKTGVFPRIAAEFASIPLQGLLPAGAEDPLGEEMAYQLVQDALLVAFVLELGGDFVEGVEDELQRAVPRLFVHGLAGDDPADVGLGRDR